MKEIIKIIDQTLEEMRNPYPTEIFVEIKKEQFAEIDSYLKKGGYSLTCLSGNIGRILWEGWMSDLKYRLHRADWWQVIDELEKKLLLKENVELSPRNPAQGEKKEEK